MLYDLLAFFVPPVLGTLTCHILMVGRKRTGWLVLTVIAAVIGYEELAFRMRFRGVWTEVLYTAAGTFAVMLIFMTIPFENQDARRRSQPKVYAHPSSALLFFLVPVASFTLVGRVDQAQKIATTFDGVVLQAYHSRNHNVPSVVIAQADGSTAVMENVDRATWDDLVPRQSHLTKFAWSVDGELDGKPVRIVPKSKVMFLGPFPD
jgi:hypothetical protein